jgi:hypothetical protein
MTIYSNRCKICGDRFSTPLSYMNKCAYCNNAQALTLQRDVKKETLVYRDSSSSSAMIPRNGAALAAGFLRQPRSSDVKAREVIYKNGEWRFREEYR